MTPELTQSVVTLESRDRRDRWRLPWRLDPLPCRRRASARGLAVVALDGRYRVAYPEDMAAPAALLENLLALGESQRVAIAHAFLDLDEAGRFEIAQALLGSVHDGMTERERAELDAAIDRGLEDVKAGRTRPVEEVIASLRAKRARTTD